MSIFGKIKEAILGKSAHAAERPTTAPTQPEATPSAGTTVSSSGQAPTSASATGATAPAAAPASGASIAAAPTTAAAAPAPSAAQAGLGVVGPADVTANLEALAKEKGSDLNWRSSIVDLMKLLDIDSSLANRKDLAKELNYTGDLDGSAEMNIWLHKAVMRELAKNGGKVPSELTD